MPASTVTQHNNKGRQDTAQDTFSASQSSVGNSHRYIFTKQLTVMIETFYNQYLF